MDNPLQQRDVAITSNPEDRIQTFWVTIRDVKTGEEVRTTTHNYTIEECALHTKENLNKEFEVVQVFQPDTKAVMKQKDILEL